MLSVKILAKLWCLYVYVSGVADQSETATFFLTALGLEPVTFASQFPTDWTTTSQQIQSSHLAMGPGMVTKQEKCAANLTFDSDGIYTFLKKSVVLGNEWQMICIKELQMTI